ncbi:MAG: metal-dependent transcriptional regulator [Armatimonadetes bacterium]|nr:MAG: metal-dependent transcriptional regulator [Armatimonadota bacterium]
MTQQTHIPTEAEEMYLITIARAVEDGSVPPIPVSDVARVLEVSSVSANQMVKKLEGLGLVDYTPYKGVSLTDEGSLLADSVLRSRRLWGLFLSEHLGLTPERADEVACEMEHVTPELVANRLAGFLGDPQFGPTGKPIPHARGAAASDGVPLAEAPPGADMEVLEVAAPFDAFLSSQGAVRGSIVAVLASAADGSVVLQTSNGPVQLAADAAAAIRVKPIIPGA